MLEKEILKNIPSMSGVYFFIGKTGDIIYAGKALSLKDRTASYFSSFNNDIKVAEILRNSIMLKYYVTKTEKEALILEDRLIKKLQPRYNMLQKDSKTFPYITITAEDFPRVFLTRTCLNDKALYFGPYPDVKTLKQLMKYYSDFLVIRKCKKKITAGQDGLAVKKTAPCLYHHIGQCPAPCAGLISRKDYSALTGRVADFLSGGKKDYIGELENKMKEAASQNKFEEAARLRDVLSCLKINFDRIRLRRLTDKDLEDISGMFVPAYNDRSEALKKALEMKTTPVMIDGFDISNLGANYAVGSKVCFFNGAPLKSQYRRYRIKTVSGQNDFEMIREIVFRCYKRKKDEGDRMPDIVLIDGGSVQVRFALNALNLLGLSKIKIIGLAKKFEEVIGSDGNKINMPEQALNLLKSVRDEAHRFAGNYHRKLRK